jgi:DNA gyrase/topoisomerase IV subunit A
MEPDGWLMNARNKRRWSDLCGEAEVEEDLEKLQKLAEQITRILDDEQARLKSLQIKLKQNP